MLLKSYDVFIKILKKQILLRNVFKHIQNIVL
jgi:hypothetical protein